MNYDASAPGDAQSTNILPPQPPTNKRRKEPAQTIK